MNKNKKFFSFILGIIIIILVVILIYNLRTATNQENAVKIGVIAPLSGAQAIYGQGVREGLDIALDEINTKSNKKIELIYEDNGGDVKNSVSAAKKLIDINQVVVLIVVLSQHAVAVAPIAQEQKVVLYSISAHASALDTAGDYVFKNDDSFAALSKEMAAFISKAGYKNVGLVYGAYNDANKDVAINFQKEFEALGSKVALEPFTKDETDFRTYLTKLNAKDVDAFLVSSLVADNSLIVKQIGELNLKQKVFGNSGMEDQQLINTAKEAAEGVIFFTYNGIPSEEFIGKIRKKYNHEPIRWSMEAYDGLMIIELALSKIKQNEEINSEKIRDALTTVTEYNGVAGKVMFDSEGNAHRKAFTKIVEDGKFVLYREEQ